MEDMTASTSKDRKQAPLLFVYQTLIIVLITISFVHLSGTSQVQVSCLRSIPGLSQVCLCSLKAYFIGQTEPKNSFLLTNHHYFQVLQQQKEAGATGITTVLGPPVHSFPPLFRQTGPYTRYYMADSISRQTRVIAEHSQFVSNLSFNYFLSSRDLYGTSRLPLMQLILPHKISCIWGI